MEFKKFKLKFVRSKPKFYAKYVRLVLKALTLCKIYAKFNAKYVRSTLQFNAIYVRSTPKINAKLCKIGVECVEFMYDLR